jgi:hypothetical protein
VRSAVDSSILFDVLLPDPKFGPASAELLRQAIDSGAVVACEIVWAEVRAAFPDDVTFNGSMATLGVEFEPATKDSAILSGRIWKQYRAAKGGARQHLIPDFLVGAHALLQADRLISRDRGFYRGYFAKLNVSDPSTLKK